jgi:hypothetical protein
MIRYRFDFPRELGRFSPLTFYYRLPWFSTEGGRKIGHGLKNGQTRPTASHVSAIERLVRLARLSGLVDRDQQAVHHRPLL